MCGKVGKALFGGGSAPPVTKVDPVATMVNVGDDTKDNGDDGVTSSKKKKGFSSTQLRDFRSGLESILGNTSGKNKLGG